MTRCGRGILPLASPALGRFAGALVYLLALQSARADVITAPGTAFSPSAQPASNSTGVTVVREDRGCFLPWTQHSVDRPPQAFQQAVSEALHYFPKTSKHMTADGGQELPSSGWDCACGAVGQRRACAAASKYHSYVAARYQLR